MNQAELDSVLEVVENPVRRRIIKRLSEEACYALQLSKELGLGQPLVAKHLSVMEKAGLVTSAVERSPNGPSRKRYSLAKSISITMDVAPHLFKEKAVSFATARPKSKGAKAIPYGERIQEALSARGERSRLSSIASILSDLDGRIGSLDDERVDLLTVRNDLMNEAAKIVAQLDHSETRRVAFHILEEHDKEVESISQSLDMRELLVRSILEELERDFFG